MLSAIFLIQLLTSRQKIRFALLLILGVGTAAAVQCIDQKTATNETIIQAYEHNPADQLGMFGIERTAWNTGCMSTGCIPKTSADFC